MSILRMSDLDLAGNRVLIREDLNVPIADGRITSEQRITAALPTLRVDQWIRFAPLSESAARALGRDPEEPGFVMELRGYTLRDRPLYYQSVSSGPFSERLMVIR